MTAKYRFRRALNKQRAAKGLPKLKSGPKLADKAQEHSDWQAEQGYITHAGFQERIKNDAFDYHNECVGWSTADLGGAPTQMLENFFASGPHKANLLSKEISHVGIGTTRGKGVTTRRVYWTVIGGG